MAEWSALQTYKCGYSGSIPAEIKFLFLEELIVLINTLLVILNSIQFFLNYKFFWNKFYKKISAIQNQAFSSAKRAILD